MNNRKIKFSLLIVSVLIAVMGAYWFFSGANKTSKLLESLPYEHKVTLDQSSELTMLSLFPIPIPADSTDIEFKDLERFHEYPVLGKVQVKDQKRKKQLLEALYKGINDGDEEEVASCFTPRHGIRAIHDGKTFDLLICFGCQQFQIFPKRKNGQLYTPITRSVQPIFDRVLRNANVPLEHR